LEHSNNIGIVIIFCANAQVAISQQKRMR